LIYPVSPARFPVSCGLHFPVSKCSGRLLDPPSREIMSFRSEVCRKRPVSPNQAPVRPELIFCLCAASGTNTQDVVDALSTELKAVGYEAVNVRLSSLMAELPGNEALQSLKFEDERIRESMRAGNRMRAIVGSDDAVVRLGIAQILRTRGERSGDRQVQAEGVCFIINSLKREEEIELLRVLYGKRVFMISIYEPEGSRIDALALRIARSRASGDIERYKPVAKQLIDIDKKERGNPHGQRLDDVFPLADCFLKYGPDLRMNVERFVQLLFGAPFTTPTIDELMMFHAKSSAQRSADLSRQVGAVIATKRGEVLATGCNEVPRAGGGVIWDAVAGTPDDHRDYREGVDAAAAAKNDIVADALGALKRAGWLSENLASYEPEQLALMALFDGAKPLASAKVSSLLEFGRIVHAEMAAICDAAQRGVAVDDATLYCTTFPCHVCARHIIAAGISRVVYIEPYPKSQAKKLYRRAVRVDEDREASANAVAFEAFVGVAPSRFFDLFSFVERKNRQGYALPERVTEGAAPKSVAVGSYASELESSYLDCLDRGDWSESALGEEAGGQDGS
uniref:anti-phage dCTP deaminase n=1 Tax=Salinarimonas chemoclinalis TaxID=3241599 RepID=UPI0035581F52